MVTSDFRDFLKTINLSSSFQKFYAGKLDTKYEKSICVFPLRSSGNADIAIGAEDATETKEKTFTVLIHWTKNFVETEKIAVELYDTLKYINNATINDYKIEYIQMLQSEPVNVDMDETTGIYEQIIEIKIFYSKIN